MLTLGSTPATPSAARIVGPVRVVVSSGLPYLTAKPMLVTCRLVLLLLDYWPLGRLDLPECSRHTPCAY